MFEELMSALIVGARNTDPIGFGKSLALLWIAYYALKPKFLAIGIKLSNHLAQVEIRLDRMIESVKDLQTAFSNSELAVRDELHSLRDEVEVTSEKVDSIDRRVVRIEEREFNKR